MFIRFRGRVASVAPPTVAPEVTIDPVAFSGIVGQQFDASHSLRLHRNRHVSAPGVMPQMIDASQILDYVIAPYHIIDRPRRLDIASRRR